MLSVVLVVIPGTFGLLMWNAYRKRKDYEPPKGAERW